MRVWWRGGPGALPVVAARSSCDGKAATIWRPSAGGSFIGNGGDDAIAGGLGTDVLSDNAGFVIAATCDRERSIDRGYDTRDPLGNRPRHDRSAGTPGRIGSRGMSE